MFRWIVTSHSSDIITDVAFSTKYSVLSMYAQYDNYTIRK